MSIAETLYRTVLDLLETVSTENFDDLPTLLESSRNLAQVNQHHEYNILFSLHLEGFRQAHFSPAIEELYRTLESPAFNPFLSATNDRTFAEGLVQSASISQLVNIVNGLVPYHAVDAASAIEEIKNIFSRIISRIYEYISFIDSSPTAPATIESSEDSVETRNKIFIGHGNSETWIQLRDYIHRDLSLGYEEFNSVSPAGLPNLYRLSQMLDNSIFAFLVFTSEDQHADGTWHARGNVIHELGLTQGRFGFTRSIVLLEENCGEISNIAGVSQIRFPHGDILAKRDQILEVLRREGIIS
jgi:hypothetical protein